jgi:hypothetical protein
MPLDQNMSREQLERETANALVASMSPDHPDNDEHGRSDALQRCLRSLPKFTPEALTLFRESADTRLGEELLHLLAYKYRSEQYLVDWILINPYSGVGQNADVHYVVRALPHYDHIAPLSNSKERSEQSRAILRVTDYLAGTKQGYNVVSDGDDEYAIITDEKLRLLLTTHKDPAAVADIIVNRGITDADQIVKLLATMNEDATVLNDGTL